LDATVNGRQVTLTWNSADSPNTFTIEAGNGPGLANLATLGVAGSLRVLVGDAPPGQYYVRIRAQNACGVSGASGEIEVVVQ
jgi:hypothetical protein